MLSGMEENKEVIKDNEKRKEYCEQFTTICDKFYFKQDRISGHIMSLIEFSFENMNFSTINLYPSEKEKVEKGLEEIGIIDSKWLFPEDRVVYLDIKKKRREEWHRCAAIRLTSELEALIANLIKENVNGERETIQLINDLYVFLKKYSNKIGVSPLVKGLNKIFELGLTNINSREYTWQLEDGVLTQLGSTYMSDATILLIKTLGFIPHNLEERDGTKTRDWKLNEELSIFQLQCILKLFDKEKSGFSIGQASGRVLGKEKEPTYHSIFSRCTTWLFYPAHYCLKELLIHFLLLWIKIKNF